MGDTFLPFGVPGAVKLLFMTAIERGIPYEIFKDVDTQD